MNPHQVPWGYRAEKLPPFSTDIKAGDFGRKLEFLSCNFAAVVSGTVSVQT
jgi:hypothetical protein